MPSKMIEHHDKDATTQESTSITAHGLHTVYCTMVAFAKSTNRQPIGSDILRGGSKHRDKHQHKNKIDISRDI